LQVKSHEPETQVRVPLAGWKHAVHLPPHVSGELLSAHAEPHW
jgi:hypothetical protein